MTTSKWLNGISNVQKQLEKNDRAQGYIDLSKEEGYPTAGENPEDLDDSSWIRIHRQPNEKWFHPHGDPRPFSMNEIEKNRSTYVILNDDTRHEVHDEDWNVEEPPIGGEWTGKTWFTKLKNDHLAGAPVGRDHQ